MREKQDLPKIFHETLTRQFGEIIRETEELVDKGYILMTHEKIFDLLAKHSGKIKDYSKIEVYRDWFSRSDDDDGMYTLSERAFELQKRYFIKTDEEIQTSENILATLRNEPYFHGSDRCDDIFYFEDISNSKAPHYYLHPSCISEIGTIRHEFKAFKEKHKIPSDVCSKYFILRSLVENSTKKEYEIVSNGTTLFKVEKHNPLEVISQYAAKNYIQEVISSIMYEIEQDREANSFLVKEIYKATRKYSSDDIDRHLTTDIPYYPCTEGATEVLEVYYHNSVETGLYEFLFITQNDCFSVKQEVDYPFRDWFHTTQVHQYGSVANIFGKEIKLDIKSLTSLKTLEFNGGPLHYADTFSMNEQAFKKYCELVVNTHLYKYSYHYYINHIGAWIASPHQLNNEYSVSVNGIERERFRENGEICLTEEEKSALEQQRLNATPAQLHAPEPEQEETQDFDDFNFGGEPDESLSVKLDSIEKLAKKEIESLIKDITRKTRLHLKSNRIIYEDTIFENIRLPEPIYDEYITSFKPKLRSFIKRSDNSIYNPRINYIKLVSGSGHWIISLKPIIETYIEYKLDSELNPSTFEEYVSKSIPKMIENTNKATRDLLQYYVNRTSTTEDAVIESDNSLRNFFMKIITHIELNEEEFEYDKASDALLIDFCLNQREYTNLNDVCSTIGLNKIILIERPNPFCNNREMPDAFIFFETHKCVYLIETNTSFDSNYNKITIRNKMGSPEFFDDIELSSDGLTLLEMMYYDNGLIVLEPNFGVRKTPTRKRTNRLFKAVLLAIPAIIIGIISYLTL